MNMIFRDVNTPGKRPAFATEVRLRTAPFTIYSQRRSLLYKRLAGLRRLHTHLWGRSGEQRASIRPLTSASSEPSSPTRPSTLRSLPSSFLAPQCPPSSHRPIRLSFLQHSIGSSPLSPLMSLHGSPCGSSCLPRRSTPLVVPSSSAPLLPRDSWLDQNLRATGI